MTFQFKNRSIMKNQVTLKFLAVRAVIIGSLALTLFSCASTTPPIKTTFGSKSVVYIPEIGVQSTVDVGQTILSKAYLTKAPGIKVPSTVLEVVNSPGVTTIQAGVLPLLTVSESGKYYSDSRATYTMLGATVPSGERAGIYVPNDSTQPAVIYHYTSSYKLGKTPVPGVEQTIIETWGEDSFKRELVYLGVQQNSMTIQYREFKNDIARPAFTQEIKYDLSQGKEIGYTGSRFEIIRATNTELVYKVLKPLD
jgi:hypothetical protein